MDRQTEYLRAVGKISELDFYDEMVITQNRYNTVKLVKVPGGFIYDHSERTEEGGLARSSTFCPCKEVF